MDLLHGLFRRAPEIALFLSLAIGYTAGRLQWGTHRLGTATGTLVAAAVVSLAGVHIDAGVHTVLLALFLYAAGFESGPLFTAVLRAEAGRAAGVALVFAAAAAATLWAVRAAGLPLPDALAAGVFGPLRPDAQDGPRALGTLLGLVAALLVCGHLLPALLRSSLLDEAQRADVALSQGVPVLGPGQQAAAPVLVGRLYRVAAGPARTVADVEAGDGGIAIARIRRGHRFVDAAPHVQLANGDIVLVVGRRESVLARARDLGEEVHGVDGMVLSLQRRDVVITRPSFDGRSIGEIRATAVPGVRHGVVVVQLSRMGRVLPLVPETVVRVHDTVSFHGTEQDVARVAALVGDPVLPTARTDLLYLAGGLVAGLLLGLPSMTVGGAVLTLGAGGPLLAGVAFGWYRAKRQTFGAVPPAALRLLKDLTVGGLVATIVLGAAAPALTAVRSAGADLFVAAVLLAFVPLLVALLAGRWLSGPVNGALLGGALAGACTSAPAAGDVIDRADSAVPVAPFVVAGAIAGLLGAWWGG